MLVYVGETLFWLWAISLSHDAGESESLNDMKKKVLLKTITLENVFSVSAYTLPFTGVCKLKGLHS